MRKQTKHWTPKEWKPRVKAWKIRQPHKCEKCGVMPHIEYFVYENGGGSWDITCPECGSFTAHPNPDAEHGSYKSKKYLDGAILLWNKLLGKPEAEEHAHGR